MRNAAIRCMFAFLMGALASVSFAETRYFKWYDREGNVYFGQKPPPGMDISEKDKWSRSINVVGGARKTQSAEQPQDGDTDASEPENETVTLLPPKNPERCAQAKNNLSALSVEGRVRVSGKNGEPRELTEEERASFKARAQSIIDQEC